MSPRLAAWLAESSLITALAVAVPDEPRLAYELDLTPVGTPAVVALTERELAERLEEAGFTTLVLWIAPDDPASAAWPREPRARRVADPATLDERLAALVATFRERELDVAIGVRIVADVGAIAPIPDHRFVHVDATDRPTLRFRRVGRPAVRDVPWSGTIEFPEGEAAIALSSRLLTPTDPALRPRQARLDVEACALDPLPSDEEDELRGRSELVSRAAEWIAGSDTEAYDVLRNEWIGGAPAGPLPILRRGEPLLDLEELAFSLDSRGRSLLDTELRGPLPPAPSEPASDPLARLLDAHRRAAIGYARFLATGEATARVAVSDALAGIESALPEFPDRAAAWQRTLAADRALLAAAEPWRIRTTRWTLQCEELEGGSLPLALARADDPRLGAWASRIETALGGRAVDLWTQVRVRAGLAAKLRTEVSQRDPRNARLRVEAAARRTVRVNGAVLVDALEATRGPLLATLPLPAGTSAIEVDLLLDGTSGALAIDLDLLPNRVEGIVLEPERASRVREPVVKLGDPTALGGTSLVRPAGREVRSSGEESASAALPFPLTTDSRLDTWVHVLALPDRAAALTLRFDEQPPRTLDLLPRAGWAWLRAPAPATLSEGDHALTVGFPTENVRVDQLVLLPSDTWFPRAPDDADTLAGTAWRFDPLGAGIVVDLPSLRSSDLFGRAFTLAKGGNYAAFVWLKGSDPLAPGQWNELEVSSSSGRQRFVLPCGVPYEEWVALGRLNFAADDRVEVRAQGNGTLSRVAFVR